MSSFFRKVVQNLKALFPPVPLCCRRVVGTKEEPDRNTSTHYETESRANDRIGVFKDLEESRRGAVKTTSDPLRADHKAHTRWRQPPGATQHHYQESEALKVWPQEKRGTFSGHLNGEPMRVLQGLAGKAREEFMCRDIPDSLYRGRLTLTQTPTVFK